MTTASRYRVVLSDGATITVNRINTQPGAILTGPEGWRRAYGYTIRSTDGELIYRGRDLGGPADGRWADDEAPTAKEMTASLLSFLLAAVEHYNAHVFLLKRSYDSRSYVPHFSLGADEWCYMASPDLEAASLDLEPEA